MKVIKVQDKKAFSETAAAHIINVINNKKDPVLGLATGSTPEGMYAELVERHKHDGLTFKQTKTFNLDEYVGLTSTHRQSYRYYMDEHFFNHIDIPKENTFIPNGVAKDLQAECIAYEEAIKAAGGIDILVLGVGLNGHIGFNEPGTSFASRTHIVELTENTREVNSRFFEHLDEVPTEALTMGLGTIMEAKEIIFLVSGEVKAKILHEIVHGEVTTNVPASILQHHPNVTLITDIDV